MDDNVSDARYRWHLRVRSTSTDAQWGVIGEIKPVDWQVTRAKGTPASARVVLGSFPQTDEVTQALVDIAEGAQRTYGLSCWHEDRPEPDHDALFFGPIVSVDFPSDGTISINAKDMSHLMDGYSVGEIEEASNHQPIALFTGIVQDFNRKYPQSNGIQFLPLPGDVIPLPTLAFGAKADDGRTLGDVVRDYLSAHPELDLIHGRSIDLRIGRPKDYAPSVWRVEAPLRGTAVSRRIGVGSEGTVTHIIQDQGDGKRTVTTRHVTPGEGQGDAALFVRVGSDVPPSTVTAIADAAALPDLTATIVSLHQWNSPPPIPGQEVYAQIPLPIVGEYDDRFRYLYFRGTVSQVTIEPTVITVDAEQHPVI